jgi:hypothetical protein
VKQTGQKLIEQAQVLSRSVASMCAVDQFGFDDRAQSDLGRAMALQALSHTGRTTVE